MHSSISSFKIFRSARKSFTGFVCCLMLVSAFLLLSSTAAAGQALNGAKASTGETPASPVAVSSDQFSDSKAAPVTDSVSILRNAKLIYIRKMTAYIEATELENELRKRPEFQRWGLAITRNEADADLILEVNRKVFTRFVYSVIDPRTNIVVLSGKLSSLGGTLSTKIAKRFIEQMQRVRQ
jgi:hypothetical protein